MKKVVSKSEAKRIAVQKGGEYPRNINIGGVIKAKSAEDAADQIKTMLKGVMGQEVEIGRIEMTKEEKAFQAENIKAVKEMNKFAAAQDKKRNVFFNGLKKRAVKAGFGIGEGCKIITEKKKKYAIFFKFEK
jgi:hypothetical protein